MVQMSCDSLTYHYLMLLLFVARVMTTCSSCTMSEGFIQTEREAAARVFLLSPHATRPSIPAGHISFLILRPPFTHSLDPEHCLSLTRESGPSDPGTL